MPIQARPYAIGYTGEASLLGDGGMQLQQAGVKVIVTTEMHAAVDPTLEGADVALAFYEAALRSTSLLNNYEMHPNAVAGGGVGLSAGALGAMARVAEHGLPVWTATVVETEIEVGDSPMAGMMQTMLGKIPGMGTSVSVSVVETISTDPLDPGLFYDGGMPPGYTVRTMEVGAQP